MSRIFSRFSSTVSATTWSFAIGLVVILALGWAFRQGDAPPFEQALHAATTQAGSNFVMATGQIDEAHQVFHPLAGCGRSILFPLRRHPHNQRHVRAGIVKIALPARQCAAMIAEVEHDRIVV